MNTRILLNSIAEVETGFKDNKIGADGERSRYQISADTWYRHTDKDFRLCGRDLILTDKIANLHVAYLVRFTLEERGKTPSVYDIAVMWNAGEGYYKSRGFNKMRVSKSIRDYANRVENLYGQNTKP